ncbi:MAG TPA: hypothetical protein VJU13_04200 [Candidatus Nitrosocosmicus sp.]|nr:hypothetical protein [Candidatus Nitrosocosmicus sp.]
MDDLTFRQLKESNYFHPEVTDVIFESDKMLEMGIVAINSTERGFDIVWDKIMLDFLWKFYKVGILLAEKHAKERNIKFRLIVEITKENMESVKSFKYHEIKHIDNIRSNFAVLDNRAYMVQIFHKENEPPAQALFSNTKALVDSQQALFNRLWEIATPIANRLKEIEYQDKLNYQRILTNPKEIQNEINSLIEQCGKELLIFSSFKLIYTILNKNDFVNKFKSLLRKGITIKILTDDIDEYLMSHIAQINGTNKDNPMQFGHSNRLGEFNEFIMLSDNKYVLQIKYDQQNEIVASFSNEKHNVLIQEILFEKYWNEVNSLEVGHNK